MNSPCERSAIGISARAAAYALLLVTVSCSTTHRRDAGVPGPVEDGGGVPPATGDQFVFGAIDVAVEVFDYDDAAATADSKQRPATSVTSRIAINGGTSEGRVPGLRILGGAIELDEVGSAGFPQQFSFDYSPEGEAPIARMVLEFRYQGSTFAIEVEPLDVEITSPEFGETIQVEETLIVRWQGIEEAPSGVFGFSGGNCSPPFTLISVGDTSATFSRGEPVEAGDSCDAEISSTWSSDRVSVPDTPFRSFEVTRSSRRIHRFRIEPQ